eukprot:gene34029-biopygen4819
MDDFLILASTEEEAFVQRERVRRVLARLGLSRNEKKGQWEPGKLSEHLGLEVDLRDGLFRVTEARVNKFHVQAKSIICDASREKRWLAARRLAAFNGLCQSVYLAVEWSEDLEESDESEAPHGQFFEGVGRCLEPRQGSEKLRHLHITHLELEVVFKTVQSFMRELEGKVARRIAAAGNVEVERDHVPHPAKTVNSDGSVELQQPMSSTTEAVPAGTRLKIYWKLDDACYPGVVLLYDNDGFANIVYDDGDKEVVDLAEEIFSVIGDVETTIGEKTFFGEKSSLLTDEVGTSDPPTVTKENKIKKASFLEQAFCLWWRTELGTSEHSELAMQMQEAALQPSTKSNYEPKASSLQPYLSAINNYHEDLGYEAPAKGRSVTRAEKGMTVLQTNQGVISDDVLTERTYLPAQHVWAAQKAATALTPRTSEELRHLRAYVYTVVAYVTFGRLDTGVAMQRGYISSTEDVLSVVLLKEKGRRHHQCVKFDIRLVVEWVPSEENQFADALSRKEIRLFFELHKEWKAESLWRKDRDALKIFAEVFEKLDRRQNGTSACFVIPVRPTADFYKFIVARPSVFIPVERFEAETDLFSAPDYQERRELEDRVAYFELNAVDRDTRSSDDTGGKQHCRFAVWADVCPVFPASEHTMELWSTFLARTVKYSTIKAYLAALRDLHLELGYTMPGFEELKRLRRTNQEVEGQSQVKANITAKKQACFAQSGVMLRGGVKFLGKDQIEVAAGFSKTNQFAEREHKVLFQTVRYPTFCAVTLTRKVLALNKLPGGPKAPVLSYRKADVDEYHEMTQEQRLAIPKLVADSMEAAVDAFC